MNDASDDDEVTEELRHLVKAGLLGNDEAGQLERLLHQLQGEQVEAGRAPLFGTPQVPSRGPIISGENCVLLIPTLPAPPAEIADS